MMSPLPESNKKHIQAAEGEGGMPKETVETVSWADFVAAVRVFKDDYLIVNHPDTPVRAPWDEPNKTGEYSLTQIPEGMTEEEFKEKVAGVTDVVFTCMDKDCTHSTWEKMRNEQVNVLMFSWGGGVVQHDIEGREGAVDALVTIATYLAQLKREGAMPQLERIHADDHDNVCGAVKAFLGGMPLHELLSQLLNKEVLPHSSEEQETMVFLIRHAAQIFIGAFRGTEVEVKAEVHITDREQPENSALKQLDLGSDLPEIDVAALLKFRDWRLTH